MIDFPSSQKPLSYIDRDVRFVGSLPSSSFIPYFLLAITPTTIPKSVLHSYSSALCIGPHQIMVSGATLPRDSCIR